MIKNVPTNIITGALGVGKTTLIRALLAQKPAHEKWAVLVNEFGEVGIDAALLSSPSEPQVFIKEVPGGCMCCTSGLPMQIALNQLLAHAKPDRLLIEPTGLGHPKEVVEALTAPHYQDVLHLQATLTLIDATRLRDEKWRTHPIFIEQVEIADAIVLTKSQNYTEQDRENLSHYLKGVAHQDVPIIDSDTAHITTAMLDGQAHKHWQQDANQTASQTKSEHSHSHKHERSHSHASEEKAENTEIQKFTHIGKSYCAYGWIIPPHITFTQKTLFSTLETINVERLKGVLQTDLGPVFVNQVENTLSKGKSDYCDDSRIEFICATQTEADIISTKIEALFPG